MNTDPKASPIPLQSPAASEPAPTRETNVVPTIRLRSERHASVPLLLMTLVLVVLGVGFGLLRRASANVNAVALASNPKGVVGVRARPAQLRERRRYVGTLEPWLEAKVGPQLVSAYVSTVLVRPGLRVRKGEVLATLDCRNSSAENKSIELQARALDARQRALASETVRFQSLLERGFVSPNEVEQRQAQTAAESAQLAALQAHSVGKSLEVDDCILRAPFDGEIATREVDPGVYVRPGTTLVSLADRHLFRVVANVPEKDFDSVAPGTPIGLHLVSNQLHLDAKISRRSPVADAATRTIHLEVDLDPGGRELPAGTTVELELELANPAPALKVPLTCANVRGDRATLFVVRGKKAHQITVSVLGEQSGSLYVGSELPADSLVITEGRRQLFDGDEVLVREEKAPGVEEKAP